MYVYIYNIDRCYEDYYFDLKLLTAKTSLSNLLCFDWCVCFY